MWRYLIILCSLLGGSDAMWAQTIGHYEYWLDGRHQDRVVVTASGAELPLSAMLTVPVDQLAAGLHCFHFRATNSNGAVGDVYSTLFYLPEAEPLDVSGYEYWLDGRHQDRVVVTASGAELPLSASLAVPVGQLAAGLHCFHFRATNSNDAVGDVYSTLFYLPEAEPLDVSGYEYWLDDDSLHAVTAVGGRAMLNLVADVSMLSDGLHTFTFRAWNSLGTWGPLHVETFEVTTPTAIAQLAGASDGIDVYNLRGEKVLSGATVSDLHRLPRAVYMVQGRKILIR